MDRKPGPIRSDSRNSFVMALRRSACAGLWCTLAAAAAARRVSTMTDSGDDPDADPGPDADAEAHATTLDGDSDWDWVLKSNRTIYRVSAFTSASPGARNVGGGIGSGGGASAPPDKLVGVLTSCMTPEYQSPSGPGAHTLLPIIERLAKRRLVDMFTQCVDWGCWGRRVTDADVDPYRHDSRVVRVSRVSFEKKNYV